MKHFLSVVAVVVAVMGVSLAEEVAAEVQGVAAGVAGVDCVEVSESKGLTLEEALTIALQHNPQVEEVRWQVEEQRAVVRLARAAQRPALRALAGYDHYTRDQRLAQPTSPRSTASFGPGIAAAEVQLGFPLFTGGRLRNRVSAAEAMSEVAEGRLGRTREEVTFNVTSLYYALLAQSEVIRSAAFAVDAMLEQRRVIAEQVEADKAARVDLLRADVRVAALRENLTREENYKVVQQRMLAAQLGWQERTLPDARGSLPEIESIPELNSARCIAEALTHRADYAALQREIVAHQHVVRADSVGRWPEMSLVTGYGVRWMPDESEGAGGSQSYTLGRVGVEIEWPFGDGGASEARRRAAEARLEAAHARLQALELVIRQEIEIAHADVSAARERVVTSGAAIEQALESFRIMCEKQELGKGTLRDVLDAQAELMQTETASVRAYADLVLAYVRGQMARGVLYNERRD